MLLALEGQHSLGHILGNGAAAEVSTVAAYGGSGYRAFLRGLGWEVNLATHKGFGGGLDLVKGGRDGQASHYWADATTEVMFHVATKMPTKVSEYFSLVLRFLRLPCSHHLVFCSASPLVSAHVCPAWHW